MVVVRFVVLMVVASCSFHDGQRPDDATIGDGDPARDVGMATGSDAGPVEDAFVEQVGLVQEAQGYATNSNAPLSATFTVAPAAGHVLVMVGAAEHGGLASVTGGGVATWTRATRTLTNTNIEIWFGVTDGSSATVTINFPPYTLPMWLAISEWSGMATTNILDGTTSTSGNTSPASAGSITTTHAHDLVIFGVSDGAPNTFGMPAPNTWTPMLGVSSNVIVQAAWYRVVTTAGAHGPAVDETRHSWDAAIAALRIAP